MGKRMTATEKWDKEWFMNLSPKLKCLWIYINDKCDQAGMWEANYKLASMHIGENVSESDVKKFEDRIEFFATGKIWICGHVEFQCGTLSEKSPAHKPVFRLLKKYNLLDRVLNRLCNSLKEIEEEKEKEDGKRKRQGHIPKLELFENLFTDELYIGELARAYPKADLQQAFEEMYIHHSQSPNEWEVWQWRQKFNTWLTIKKQNDGKHSKGGKPGITAEGTRDRLNSYTN